MCSPGGGGCGPAAQLVKPFELLAGVSASLDVLSPETAALLRAVQAQGRAVLWVSDPVHGNGYTSENGFKTRDFDAIRAELEAFLAQMDAVQAGLDDERRAGKAGGDL